MFEPLLSKKEDLLSFVCIHVHFLVSEDFFQVSSFESKTLVTLCKFVLYITVGKLIQNPC